MSSRVFQSQKVIPVNNALRSYKALPTCRRFHASDAFFRGIRGPFGSGKTTALMMELFARCLKQKPHNGVRRSRHAVIRRTYPELMSTTIKTFQAWVPPSICPISFSAPITGRLQLQLPDGTSVEAEILFLAMDVATDVDKLRSLELTTAVINEASEIDEDVLQMLSGRVRRYPSKDEGGFDYSGIMADTNPPSTRHWWYRLAEIDKPKGYEFYTQPPAVIMIEPGTRTKPPVYVPNDGSRGLPAAENVEHLEVGFDYWMQMLQGKDREWIRVFLQNEYGSIFKGKVVYPEYSDSIHLASENIVPMRGLPLLVAMDFGLTPAAAFMQMAPNGQLRVLEEHTSVDMGIERFARDIILPVLRNDYQGMEILVVGDPAGKQRGQNNETTCFEILEQQGLRAIPAPTNDFVVRRESVAWFLTRLSDGQPGFMLSPRCRMLREGFMGGYHYRRFQNVEDVRYAERPEKNEHSHVCDALAYGCSYFRTSALQYGDGRSIRELGAPKRREVKTGSAEGWT